MNGWLGLRPGPRWGSLQRSPRSPSSINGPTSKRDGRQGREGGGEGTIRKGKGIKRWKERGSGTPLLGRKKVTPLTEWPEQVDPAADLLSKCNPAVEHSARRHLPAVPPDSFKTHLNSFRFIWAPDFVLFLSSALHCFYPKLLFIVCCAAFSIHICLFIRGAILLGIESAPLSEDEDEDDMTRSLVMRVSVTTKFILRIDWLQPNIMTVRARLILETCIPTRPFIL